MTLILILEKYELISLDRYIAETAPSHARGRLVTILSLLITGGQVVAYIVGWLFSQTSGGWRWIVGLGAVPAFLQFAVLGFLPETPRWLVQAGQDDQAVAVLKRVYETSPEPDRIAHRVLRDIRGEMAEETAEMDHTKAPGSSPQWLHDASLRAQELFHGGNRRALTIAMMLQAIQQLCGFNSLMYFSGIIFSALSFSSPTLTSLTIAGTNFVFTLFAFVYIDRIGRRRILLYSIPVMIVALGLCAFTFSSMNISFSPESHSREGGKGLGPVLILLSLIIYVAAYAFGLGNVPWQQAELFPLNVRSLGSGLATATNWGSNFVVGLTFLPMMEWMTPTWTFTVYAGVCAVGWVAIRAIYPEMSGMGLEEVKGLLADGWGVKESLRRRQEEARERTAT